MNTVTLEKSLNPNFGNVLAEARCEIFIINLDHRKDRWNQLSKHLNELGCQRYQRIAAIDGLKESKQLASKVMRLEWEKTFENPTKRQMGVLGCFKSHLKALKLAASFFSQIEKALILEDDCFFIDGAAKILKRSFEELPHQWQFLMLGAVYGSAPGFVPKKNNVMRVFNATAAHAYIVNHSSCLLLINRLESILESKNILPIDELFAKYQLMENWFATHPLIAGQRSGDYSDIEGMIRIHADACFKLGVLINWKIWLWMKIRPFLPIESIKKVIKSISSIWQTVFKPA